MIEPSQRGAQQPDRAIAIILAAGPGKRMGAVKPKVLMALDGKPLVIWVLEAVRTAGIKRVIVVIGHQGEQVQQVLDGFDVEFVWQRPLLGTGHAVQQTENLLKSHAGPVAVLLGDVPRIRPETIRGLISTHCEAKASATVLTAVIDDPAGYGRIVRRSDGTLDRIVEARDADLKIKAIKEINTGTMCFYAPDLLAALPAVTSDNAQQEYYLTDVIGILQKSGLLVHGYQTHDPRDALGANSQSQLEQLKKL